MELAVKFLKGEKMKEIKFCVFIKNREKKYNRFDEWQKIEIDGKNYQLTFGSKIKPNGWVLEKVEEPFFDEDTKKLVVKTNPFYELDFDFKLMQYTGLKDKNGKEIYEGDIISIKADYLSEFNSESILPCEIVAFEDGAFGTYDKKRTLFVSFKEMIDKSDGIEFEIIGNVFENPELLESAK